MSSSSSSERKEAQPPGGGAPSNPLFRTTHLPGPSPVLLAPVPSDNQENGDSSIGIQTGNSPLKIIQREPSPVPLTSTSTVKKKQDEDFDLESYYARLHTIPTFGVTRKQSLPKPVDEDLEDVDLNGSPVGSPPIDSNQGITAELAQNFSQFQQVLPEVANAVFSSFSSILNLKSQPQKSDEFEPIQNVTYAPPPPPQDTYREVQEAREFDTPAIPIPLIDTTGQNVPTTATSTKKAVSNQFRCGQKKMMYSHFPGLTIGETETRKNQNFPPPNIQLPPLPPKNDSYNPPMDTRPPIPSFQPPPLQNFSINPPNIQLPPMPPKNDLYNPTVDSRPPVPTFQPQIFTPPMQNEIKENPSNIPLPPKNIISPIPSQIEENTPTVPMMSPQTLLPSIPPPSTSGNQFRLSNKRPQYYSGPIMGGAQPAPVQNYPPSVQNYPPTVQNYPPIVQNYPPPIQNPTSPVVESRVPESKTGIFGKLQSTLTTFFDPQYNNVKKDAPIQMGSPDYFSNAYSQSANISHPEFVQTSVSNYYTPEIQQQSALPHNQSSAFVPFVKPENNFAVPPNNENSVMSVPMFADLNLAPPVMFPSKEELSNSSIVPNNVQMFSPEASLNTNLTPIQIFDPSNVKEETNAQNQPEFYGSNFGETGKADPIQMYNPHTSTSTPSATFNYPPMGEPLKKEVEKVDPIQMYNPNVEISTQPSMFSNPPTEALEKVDPIQMFNPQIQTSTPSSIFNYPPIGEPFNQAVEKVDPVPLFNANAQTSTSSSMFNYPPMEEPLKPEVEKVDSVQMFNPNTETSTPSSIFSYPPTGEPLNQAVEKVDPVPMFTANTETSTPSSMFNYPPMREPLNQEVEKVDPVPLFDANAQTSTPSSMFNYPPMGEPLNEEVEKVDPFQMFNPNTETSTPSLIFGYPPKGEPLNQEVEKVDPVQMFNPNTETSTPSLIFGYPPKGEPLNEEVEKVDPVQMFNPNIQTSTSSPMFNYPPMGESLKQEVEKVDPVPMFNANTETSTLSSTFYNPPTGEVLDKVDPIQMFNPNAGSSTTPSLFYSPTGDESKTTDPIQIFNPSAEFSSQSAKFNCPSTEKVDPIPMFNPTTEVSTQSAIFNCSPIEKVLEKEDPAQLFNPNAQETSNKEFEDSALLQSFDPSTEFSPPLFYNPEVEKSDLIQIFNPIESTTPKKEVEDSAILQSVNPNELSAAVFHENAEISTPPKYSNPTAEEVLEKEFNSSTSLQSTPIFYNPATPVQIFNPNMDASNSFSMVGNPTTEEVFKKEVDDSALLQNFVPKFESESNEDSTPIPTTEEIEKMTPVNVFNQEPSFFNPGDDFSFHNPAESILKLPPPSYLCDSSGVTETHSEPIIHNSATECSTHDHVAQPAFRENVDAAFNLSAIEPSNFNTSFNSDYIGVDFDNTSRAFDNISENSLDREVQSALLGNDNIETEAVINPPISDDPSSFFSSATTQSAFDFFSQSDSRSRIPDGSGDSTSEAPQMSLASYFM